MRDYLVDINNYRTRKAGLPSTLTQAQWEATMKYFNRRCAYCQKSQYVELEHFVPVRRGGGTTYSNCVPACGSCNTCKDHPKFILFGDNIEAVKALLRVYDYLHSLPTEQMDELIVKEYLAFQLIRTPVHTERKRPA